MSQAGVDILATSTEMGLSETVVYHGKDESKEFAWFVGSWQWQDDRVLVHLKHLISKEVENK